MIRELQRYSGNQTAQWLILLDLSDSTLRAYLHKAPKLILKKIQPRERTAIKTNCSRCDETSDSHKWQTHEYTCAQCLRFTTKASQNFPSHRLISPAAIVYVSREAKKKGSGTPLRPLPIPCSIPKNSGGVMEPLFPVRGSWSWAAQQVLLQFDRL